MPLQFAFPSVICTRSHKNKEIQLLNTLLTLSAVRKMNLLFLFQHTNLFICAKHSHKELFLNKTRKKNNLKELNFKKWMGEGYLIWLKTKSSEKKTLTLAFVADILNGALKSLLLWQ